MDPQLTPLTAAFLGLVQGLTEFLPVSSSGHLVLLQYAAGLREPELLFDLVLHLGTLAAVFVVLRHSVAEALRGGVLLLRSAFSGRAAFSALVRENPGARMAWLIILGSIPTGAIGLVFHKAADTLFASPLIAASMLLVTGALLMGSRYMPVKDSGILEMRVRDALVIGVVQGLAILPGLSRSGSTISAALFCGVGRDCAGRFSFLVSIPAILAAVCLEFVSGGDRGSASPSILLLGASVAAVTGYAALRVLLSVVRKGRLHFFAPYCWLVGLAALATTLM
jgi:undecaprenyl-diphosphatase